jgi:hypothetical protein
MRYVVTIPVDVQFWELENFTRFTNVLDVYFDKVGLTTSYRDWQNGRLKYSGSFDTTIAIICPDKETAEIFREFTRGNYDIREESETLRITEIVIMGKTYYNVDDNR